jgi:hypothetical protein
MKAIKDDVRWEPGAMSANEIKERPPIEADQLPVYHGSRHEFTAFDPEKVGTGEGAAAYGHGVAYVAEHPEVAEQYRTAGAERAADVGEGHLYRVNLKAEKEEFLDWDKPISEEHGERINKHFAPNQPYLGGETGEEIYRTISRMEGGPR